MSEPRTKSRKVETVVPGLLHWWVQDDRISFRSDAYGVRERGKTILIDPLPLTERALEGLGKVGAICLTGSCHQRSAWRYRRLFGVPVFAPRGAEGLEEEPDRWYRKGELLPGGLRAVHAPGPTEVHFAFHRPAGRGVLFCADVLIHDGERVRFVEDEHQDEPQRTRKTARKFLGLRFGILCFAHGAPLVGDPRGAIRAAIDADRAGR